MDSHELPAAIEPDYWNLVFHPSDSRLARILLGRFQHVSAFTYIPGFKAWMIYDVQWRGTRIGFVNQVMAEQYAKVLTGEGCAILKVNCAYQHLGLASRLGFYCVPAIKQLLGLSCVAVTPDGLYRHLIANGGIVLNERIDTATAAARSNAATGAATGAG